NQGGKPVAPQWEFDLAVGSIINNVLFGYRFEEDKQLEFAELRRLLSEQMKLLAHGVWRFGHHQILVALYPGIRDVYKRIMNNRDQLFAFFNQQVQARKKTMDYDSDISNDLVECYLKEQHKHQDEPEFGYYSEAQLENVLMDLWVAGMETTSNTLNWGIAYLLNEPEVQKKIHAELDRVIKSDRTITLADKPNLNYINATLNEIQRVANLLPLNLFRKTTEDVVIAGHPVPKDTMVIPQISVVLLDEKIFPEPYAFKPERFLNADGSLKKVEELIPFSIGKRQCPGEGLARMELFMFFANLLQRFEVHSDEKPCLEKEMGITTSSRPYKCYFRERK
ncbi:unnamed protein product, partial [Mesorhabditis spiculigera]